MGTIEVEVDPGAVGFDAARLARVSARLRKYVDEGKLPGWSVAITRHGRVAYTDAYGQRDIEAGLPMELDTIVRIYSMTKPITSVAAMMLWEEGAFELKDPLYRFIPEFRDTKVFRAGSVTNPVLEPLRNPIELWHLLSHTAGLTYGFMYASPVDDLYRRAGFEWGVPPGADLAEACRGWAQLPLLFQPGTEWNYSVAVDVLGRVIEVVSGQTLDVFLQERIFEPLGMTDTAFWCPEAEQKRLAALYTAQPGTRKAVRLDAMGNGALSKPAFLGGGGGLVSTLHDYQRFSQMLLNKGELDGVRLLGPRTVDYMTQNHLPGNKDLTQAGRPLFSETAFDGVGFGLGFSVTMDPVAGRTTGSVGDFAWGGAASTAFWVDPWEDMTVVFLTQLLPSSTWPIRTQLKQLVHQAIIDD